jgi:hypothetical protein
VFLQNTDDPFFRVAAAFHVLVLILGQNELQTGLSQRGKVDLNPFRNFWLDIMAVQRER